MANLKRRNHFLPVCYQKGFTDSSNRVWVKRANELTPVHRSPRAVGWWDSLYIRKQDGLENDKIEDFWNKHVELRFAALSQRTKVEGESFSNISGAEQGGLLIFVASQVVRTLAHKRCVEEQVGNPVDTNTFANVMGNMMRMMINRWKRDSPNFQFYTSQPYVGEHFITGDSPVIVRHTIDKLLWQPTDVPKLGITNLEEILENPKYEFAVPLSPFICVSIRGHHYSGEGLPPRRIGPSETRSFNRLIQDQCKIFILARDRESLLGRD